MTSLLVACLLLTALRQSASAPPGGALQRLARLSASQPSLARSLDSSSLARRVSEDLDFEDDEESAVGKRQFDDYGHMRFGRSNVVSPARFEDYGRTRYGK